MSQVPCKACRESHKRCDLGRPCQRCLAAGRECEEPIKKKRGRPRAVNYVTQQVMEPKQQPKLEDFVMSPDADYAYERHDPRLLAALQLLLDNPPLIFANPERTAASFGITLSSDFYVSEVGPYTDNMTLYDHLRACTVRYVSDGLAKFLQKAPNSIRTPLDVEFLPDSFCSGACVKDALNAPLPVYGVRRWKQAKRLLHNESIVEVDCLGYILANMKVMFVDLGTRRVVGIAEDVDADSHPVQVKLELENHEVPPPEKLLKLGAPVPLGEVPPIEYFFNWADADVFADLSASTTDNSADLPEIVMPMDLDSEM